MASKQLVIEIISDAKKFTSGLTEAINTISKATEKAEGFEKYTEQLEAMKKELLEVTQQTAQIGKNVRTGGEIVSQEQLNRIDALTSKVESIDKRFDSFRHTFGDMQDKLNGLSTRTLQVQLDKVNASLDAFREKYSSLQQTLNIGLGNNKSIEQMSNIGELKAAYEDALKVFNNFTKETKFDGEKYSKSYIEAAKAVYEYSSALWDLNDTYQNTHNKAFYSEEVMNPIDDMMSITSEILGADLSNKLYDSLQNSIDKINISDFFKNVEGQINGQNLSGVMKNGGIIIPVKLDPSAFSKLESEINKDISALQSRANANPIKIHYETNTEELTKNIEKYFNELNTKLKNQVAELNTLMKGLVDDTGLKKTEQDFSSIAKLIPEMLRKVAEYSEQLKTITTDTKTSFENVNNFVKEENFINYANAIKQTAESFKLLTSSLDDVSSKLSGNGLEGQFDLLKKKFSELSIDSVLNKETAKETEAAKKAKIKEIKELFALYSTYQSRGGIRPFSDLISGEVDANKKAYLQLAYNDYAKNKNKKGTGTEPTPFDAKQLKDILQILKEIKQTIKSISEIKIDTSELTEAISKIQGNNNEPIFTPQNVAQIWQILIQYANNYSESLSKVIEKLEIISEKDFEPLKLDSEEFKKTYNQIESIVQLLEKGFGISLNPENQLKDNIQGITEANQTATESNQKLAESMQEVAQAAQEEKEAVIDPAVKDYLIKWIEMVKGTKAYSGMEERAVFLKGGTPASDVGQGKLSYKNGFVQGQTSIRQYKDGGADTLLHSHQYSKDVDNLRFSFADIKQGMSDLAGGVQDGIRKLILSCGNEILSLDFGNVSKETASEVQENIRQIYTAAWTIFGGQVFSDGTASERGMTDELRNKASAFINTMLRKMLEEMGGSLTSAKLVDGKMIDTTVSRLNQTITPQQQNLFEQIKKIYGLSENEYEGYRGDILKKLQKDNGIETNLTGLAGLSKTELEEIDKLLLQIFNHKQQLEKTKTGTRVESTLKEKIAEAEKRISEITKKTFPPEKTPTQQKPDAGIKENQVQQQTQQTQQAIQQTNNEIENTDQSIITLVSDIKNALNGLSSDLNILAEIIVSLNNSTEQVDYSSRISNIRGGITTLNNSIKELVDLVRQLDFDKINNIKISTEPFDKIIESLKEIIDLTERISGVPSKSSLDSQFKDIQKIYSSLVNDKGNFIVTKNKDAVQNLFSQYSKYLKFGGTKTLTDLDDSKANVNKLSKYYNKYLDNISQQNESEVSTTSSIKDEAQNFIDIRDAANEATASKESFIKANKKLETQTDKTSKSLEQEKTQFETFINDVKTLVTTDIESNNVVDFNTQILDSAKQTNEALKEELQYLQKLNEIQKTNPIKQNDIPVVSHNDSSKKQDSKKRISSFEKPDSKFDYEDLGLSYDPYLSAFQEFLLIAAEEAEKVKQQIISVAEFDNRLSEALTALYGQIPDLDDISANTGYGKDFNVTGATVSFRDKTTNDIYRKTFSLKKDKETGNFYIDQTTSILNDAEKYGKDNEKQAQKILEWQTKLNAWLQNFSNKTSGTLDSTKDFQSLKNFNLASEKDWINIKTIQQRLEGLYSEIVLNSTKGTSSLRPIPNMMHGQESRQTKKEKAESIYNRMAINWNGENGAEDTEGELKKLSSLYNNLQIEINKFNEDGSNIESVAQAYGTFNEQLNKVNEQLNRMKIINTEINGNKINNLNNWFKDMPDPNSAEGKIEKYGQVYSQFAEAQQQLNELTTNLNKGTTEEDAQNYEAKKEKIHEIVLELEEFRKILSSDSMNINNQMGQVIKQNIPETENIEELRKVINEYADTKGKIIDVSETGATIDKEGNEFVTFTRKIQDAKGVVTEFEFTYNKAMGTVAVATKKIQEPENAFKALTDELTTKWRGLFTTLASFVGFYRLWGYFKEGIGIVREFDTALTEMQKVSDETTSTLQKYQKATFDTADAIGATALQIQNSTADFMRLGESLTEAAESAKVANVLMNVSEFQSIDEATKSLIAMGAAYKDLSKMDIIDKLNEVGNNYAISTSEAATALQNSASALKTAGNSMDESLALITAGNAVVQDANKVGTGMRTIALRLTGTKSAKEQLEELGEETDSMLTTQSKLRDTIKEATAVASNDFKGFDILDDNGNYKSTYEIMLGIADVYNEIVETDKQFGRNNTNLLLESVAGKTRANIAASIFQNPQLLKDAYKSSQEADNSAMKENEKYMASINGHIAQLQNAYQQLWANSMNRDTINYFIDLGKSILKVVDNVGLLGTAFVTITGIRSIVGYQSGKGFAYETIKGIKSVIKSLAETEGKIGSLTSSAISAGKSIGGAFSNVIPIIGGIGTAIALVAVGINAYIQHQKQVQKELIDSVRTSNEEWKQQKQTLSDYASQYEELKTKLKSGNLSEQETIKIKQDIYDIQKQITEQYGKNVDNINLVNGELKEQLEIINSISKAEANEIWGSEKYQKGFNLAEEAMTTKNDYSFKQTLNPKDYKTEEDKALSHIIQKYTQEREYGRGSNQFGTYRVVSGSAIEADERILKMIEEIEKLQLEYSDNEDFQKRAKTILSDLQKNRDKIEEIRKENESSYLEGLPIKLMATKSAQDYKTYSDYQFSVSNLESAYISGDNKKIKEARQVFDEATKAKNEFLSIPANDEFAILFENINTSLIDSKNKAYDATEAFKKASEINDELDKYDESVKNQNKLDEATQKYIKDLKNATKTTGRYTQEDKNLAKALKDVINLNMDKVDAKMVFDDNAISSQNYKDALYNLLDAMGWTIDDADLMIDTLVSTGYIQGDVTDATETASGSYNSFSQTIATAVENVSKLNTVLSESVSGANISTQNLDAFKEMFGDDYVYALERTANGYHINAENLQTLTDKQNALINTDYQKTLDVQYDALKRCNEEIIKANNEQKDISGLLAQRQGILQRIQDTEDLMMTYQASTSAYQTWVNAQSNGSEYDMYEKILGGFDTVKDLIDRGFAGDDTVRSFLDLIYGDSFDAMNATGQECVEMFDNLDKKIQGTSFSIRDFFQVDDNGKLTSNGIFNFFDAVKEKQEELGKDWLKFDEDGNITDYDFGFGRDRDVAEALGMDVELVQSILRAAYSAGFEVNLDQPMWAMDELQKKAVKAQEELGGFNEIDFSELYKHIDDEDAYKTINGHIDDVYQFIQDVENSNLTPELKTKQIEQAQDMLSYLVALEREAADRGEIDLKTTVVGTATDKISQLIDNTEELPDVLKEYNWDEITDKEGLKKARDFIAAEIEGGKIDSSSAESFLNILDQALYELGLIDEYEANPTLKGNTVGAFNDIQQAREELKKYIEEAQQLENKYDIQFNFAEDDKVKELLSIIYGEGTPEILASLDIDSDKTPEEIIEMLEEGERDVDVLLKPDTSELEKNTPSSTTIEEKHNTTDTHTTISNKEENIKTSLEINDDNYEQRMALNEQRLEQLDNSKAVVDIDAIDEHYKEKANEVKNENKEISKQTPTTKFKGDNSDVINKANSAFSAANFLNTTITTIFKSSGLGGLKSDIQDAINKVNQLHTRISSVENRRISGNVVANGTAHVNGTAFIRGTAFAGGKWGLSKNQQALVGELGTELLVRDGQWQTIGDNGAEFVNLKRGDIVFNHKQAQELLENGYVTSNKGRGRLVGFANGTAFSSGTINGATRSRVSTKSVGSSNKSSSKSPSSSKGSSNNNRGNSNSNNNNNTNKEAKETKNTLDEVEILIARIERSITNLDKIIGSTYKTWATRNKKIKTQLARVAKEITAQNKAYTTYIKKANSVGLSSEWKKKIQSGKYRIEDVKDEKLWEKINQYKEYYEKALAARDAVLDLKEKEGELYKQRFDNSQSYYEQSIEYTQNIIDLNASRNDTLSEAGKLNSVKLYAKQLTNEKTNLKKLQKEYKVLIQRRDEAVKSGKIKKGSEAWYEMELAIQQVSNSIEETNKNIITLGNNIRQVDWTRWDKIHDAIGSVTEEMEFLYDLMDEDKMFNDKGEITNQGITGFALLAQQYDTYFSQVQEYQKEINKVQKQLAKDPYNQDLVDKLKELKAAQQDAAANAKKTKDSMVDLTEKGIKKQIDYVKKLIDDYEKLLESQKDQIEYAKKVTDQQKEINRLEKQYRAIQNDDSEEGATKRQQLREQLQEKRDALKETQEDRRLSETKDILSKFETSFEEFLNKKLDNVEGIVREVINTTNENRNVIRDTINTVAASYGYTPSDTLKSAINKMSTDLVSYFNGGFKNSKVNTIAEGVNAIVDYYKKAQQNSEDTATKKPTTKKPTTKKPTTKKPTTTTTKKKTQDEVNYARNQLKVAQDNLAAAKKTGNKTIIAKAESEVKEAQKQYNNSISTEAKTTTNNVITKTFVTANAKSGSGIINNNIATNPTTTAKQYKSQWVTSGGKKYYYKADGTKATGITYIAGKYYSFDKNGVLQNKSEAKVRAELIKSAGTHMLKYKDAKGNTLTGYYKDDGTLDATHTGWAKKGNKIYRFQNGKLVTNKWITVDGKKYYIDKDGARVTGKQTINSVKYTFDSNGVYKKKGWKKGIASIPKTDLAWTNEGRKPEAIIRKSDGAILTPLSKGDSVIPNSAMKNMYKALVDPEKYLKQYTIPDIKIVQSKENGSSSPATINMQFIANGVQDANKFANDLMNNKKIEKWIQEITLGQANGNTSYKKYSYAIR